MLQRPEVAGRTPVVGATEYGYVRRMRSVCAAGAGVIQCEVSDRRREKQAAVGDSCDGQRPDNLRQTAVSIGTACSQPHTVLPRVSGAAYPAYRQHRQQASAWRQSAAAGG